MRRLAAGVAASLLLVGSSPAAAQSDWMDPALAPHGPTILIPHHRLVPESPWDSWWTHAELEWLQSHGLNLSALGVLRARRAAPPPIATNGPVRSTARAEFNFSGNVEQWRPLVEAYFAAGDVGAALCVIRYESGGSPTAKNPTSSASGLWQHLARYWPERSVKAGWAGASIWDPEASTAVAAWLVYHGGGWGHWVVAWKCGR